MISYELLLYCLAAGGAYLIAATVVLTLVERHAGMLRGMPAEIVDSGGLSWLAVNFVMELLFYVVIPTLAYSFFYLLVPLSGIRAGMAVTLLALTLGAVPIMMSLSVRIRLPMAYLLFILLSYLIKLGGTLSIIGYIYSL
jgi:hypothetical protein